MKSSRWKVIISLLVLACMFPVVSWAYGNDGEKRRMSPPPEAIETCEGKQVGDSVEFTSRRGNTISAICEDVRGQLMAVPERLRERMKQR